MKKNNNQIICSVDAMNAQRIFEEIPFIRAKYDLIWKKQ